MKIDLVKEKDAQKMLEVALKAFEEDAQKYGSPPPQIDTLKWHHPNTFGGVYYKLLVDDEITGGFRVIDRGGNHYQFAAAFIAPEHQSKGYGHKIMQFIDKEYPHVKKWTLSTPYKSYRNHYFYEKHGYKKVGEYKPNPNNEFTLFLYEKLV